MDCSAGELSIRLHPPIGECGGKLHEFMLEQLCFPSQGIGWKSVFRISDCPHVLLRAQEKSVQTDGSLQLQGHLVLMPNLHTQTQQIDKKQTNPQTSAKLTVTLNLP